MVFHVLMSVFSFFLGMNIGHWNCRSFGPFARPEAAKFAREHDLAVVALCETRERSKRNEELAPGLWYFSSKARNGVGGCGFIIRNGLEAQFSPITARVAQVIVTLKTMKILSIYAPTEGSKRQRILLVLGNVSIVRKLAQQMIT